MPSRSLPRISAVRRIRPTWVIAKQVATLINRIEDEAGPIDVLVNNAGIDIAAAFWDHTADEVATIVQVNLTAPMELCRQVIPRMFHRGRGHIVNISSLASCGIVPRTHRVLHDEVRAVALHRRVCERICTSCR